MGIELLLSHVFSDMLLDVILSTRMAVDGVVSSSVFWWIWCCVGGGMEMDALWINTATARWCQKWAAPCEGGGLWFLLCESEIQNKEIGAILWAQGFIEEHSCGCGGSRSEIGGTLIEMGEVYSLIWGVFYQLLAYVTPPQGRGLWTRKEMEFSKQNTSPAWEKRDLT